MAGLDDIVQNITIEGGDEAAAALQNLGETGAEAFTKIIEAAAGGDFTGLVTLFGGDLPAAISTSVEAITEFVHAQAEAVEMASDLATAVGQTFSQFQGVGEAFASVGISTRGFDRSMGRLAQTVSTSWSEIQQSTRTASDETARSFLAIQEASLGVDKANLALSESFDKMSETAVRDSQAIANAQRNLQKAATPQAFGNAQQALSEANTKSANDEAEATLKIREAQLNVQKAVQARADAEEKAYEVSLKNLPDIAAKLNAVAAGQAKWTEGLDLAQVAAQKLVQGIILASSVGGKEPEAAQVLAKMADVFKGMGNTAEETNAKMEILQHTMGAGFRPGMASAAQIAAILSKGREELEKYQAQVEKSSFNLNDKQTEDLKSFVAAWAELGATVQRAEEKMAALAALALTQIFNAIRDAIEAAGQELQQFGKWLDKAFGPGTSASVQKWVTYIVVIGAAAVTAAAAIGAIALVVTTVGGAFIAVVAAVGSFVAAYAGIAVVGAAVGATIELIISKWGAFKSAASAAINAVVGCFDSLIQKIADVISAVSGGLIQKWGDFKSAASDAINAVVGFFDSLIQKIADVISAVSGGLTSTWDDFKSAASDAINTVVGFFDSLIQKINAVISAVSGGLMSALQAIKGLLGGGGAAPGGAAPTTGAATGGHIRGPGTGTSDTAGLYALSDGEYVVKSAAVQNYGVDFFHAINNMALGAMAMGGHVGAPVRMAAGGPVSASHTLNLTIGDQHFNGLKAPESVASRLKSYAVGRQTSSAGRSPSWRT
jgi:hypothetical protein